MKMDEYTKEVEVAREELQDILSPIYASGLPVDEFKKVLFYLSSLALKDKDNKKKVMENWTAPYIEALLLLLTKLESNEELMKQSEYFCKKH